MEDQHSPSKKFALVEDAITNQEMIIRIDSVRKIEEGTLRGRDCRIIQFIDGSTEYVTDSLKNLLITLSSS